MSLNGGLQYFFKPKSYFIILKALKYDQTHTNKFTPAWSLVANTSWFNKAIKCNGTVQVKPLEINSSIARLTTLKMSLQVSGVSHPKAKMYLLTLVPK